MPISPERQQALERVWYHGESPGLGLRVLAALYATARWISLLPWWLRLRRAPATPVAVVVVGNLSVGGTGKTPLTIALVQALRARGVAVGVISRGYGRHTRGVQLVDSTSTAADVGDEPLLIARSTRAPVVVGEDRVAALQRLCSLVPLDLVISDDGLEHHGLARRCELIVVDGMRGFGNGRLLPAGPLRAPLSRLKRAQALVWNQSTAQLPELGESGIRPITQFSMQIEASALRPLAGGPTTPLTQWRGRRAHVVAGTGNPERVFASVRALGIEVLAHPLPDHVDYALSGVPQFDDDLPCITTSKDAVKLPALAGWYVLETSARIAPELIDCVLAAVGLPDQEQAHD